MWWKLAAGGVAGLVIGSAVPPGYWLWVVLGMLAGYGVDAWQRRKAEEKKSSRSEAG